MGFLGSFKDKFATDQAEDMSGDEVDGSRVPGDDLVVDRPERPTSYESPYDADARTVVRRARTPDVKRASEAAGTTLRAVPRTNASVSPMSTDQMLVHNARPTSFSDCGLIADRFKGRQPVIIDLGGIVPEEQQRFLDFVAGLIYGLNGEISKVSHAIYLITPHGAHVSEADRARFSARSR